MSTLSVPLTPELEKAIEKMVKAGIAPNKAEAVRMAIKFFSEEQAVQSVLIAQKEAREGKLLKGNLRDLLKQI